MPVALQGATSGSVTLVAPAVAGNNTLTTPARTGNLAVDGPAFHAYPSAGTSTATGTFTKMTNDTVVYDTASCFTSSRFTPNVAGYYQFNGSISVNPALSTTWLVTLYKNGAEAIRGNQSAGGSTFTMTVSGLIYLNGTTDYVELYGYQASGITVTLGVGGTSAVSYFQGFLARAA